MMAPQVEARVLDIELTLPLPEIPSTDPRGRRPRSVWLLVRLDRTPVGVVAMPLPDAGIGPEALAVAIHEALGSAIGQTVTAAGVAVAGREERRRRRAEVLATGPELTVVVCTRDRPEELVRCLGSLAAQPYRQYRILIADNSTERGLGERVARTMADRSRIETISVPRPGLAHARNAAVAATAGEHLAWIDDDEIADEFWLSEIAEAFLDHPEADVVSGAVVPAELESPPQVWFEQFGGHSKGRGFTPDLFSPATAHRQSPLYPLPPFGVGANMATRAGVLERIGGFDEALGAGTPAKGGEDTLALTRVLLAGGTIAYHPAALTRHYHRGDLGGLRRQLIGYGTGLTAAYTAMLLGSPRLLPQLLALAPTAVRDLFGGKGVRTATISDDFPGDLLRANLRGMAIGPFAYFRGRRRIRRWP